MCIWTIVHQQASKWKLLFLLIKMETNLLKLSAHALLADSYEGNPAIVFSKTIMDATHVILRIEESNLVLNLCSTFKIWTYFKCLLWLAF